MGYLSRENDTKFYRAVRKYGRENFQIEQIDSASTQEELDDKEVYWIKYYNSVESGYNSHCNKGKCGGNTLAQHPNLENIKKKISKSKIGGKNPRAKRVKAINILTKEEKDRISVILVLLFFVTFFWAGFEQAGSTLTLYTDKSINYRQFI